MLLELLRVDPLLFVTIAVALVGAIGLHEYAHALAADLQGDRLPRAMGRLTPNPLKHLDPLGTVLLLVAGFGWGKPVEFRPQALSSRRFGAAIVALAGPTANLLLAILAGVLLGVLAGTQGLDPAVEGAFTLGQNNFLARFLVVFLSINVLLAVFNLIPIPPLDGSRLLTIFLPPSKQKIIFWLDRYGILLLLVFVLFELTRFLDPVIETVIGWILGLAT
jgi:Zn-dependent protease